MDAANTWKKRAVLSLECPSGSVCRVRRPSPEVSLKGGRIANFFMPKAQSGSFNPDTAFEELSDEEAASMYLLAREIVLAAVVEPKLSRNTDSDGLTPEDIPPSDFWFIFSWAMKGGRDLPVKLKEGETTVDAVETFPVESGALPVSGSGGEQVSQAPV